jgi:hypothetical protein
MTIVKVNKKLRDEYQRYLFGIVRPYLRSDLQNLFRRNLRDETDVVRMYETAEFYRFRCKMRRREGSIMKFKVWYREKQLEKILQKNKES